MLRTATQDQIRQIARPLYPFLNSCSWGSAHRTYDQLKCAASSIIANLAYCDIGAEERAQKNRATVVPSALYQTLIASEDVRLVELLASLDFADSVILRTERYVALVLSVGDLVLVGVRGTLFAYDWMINFAAYKRKKADVHFHSGFLGEALKLAVLLRAFIQDRTAAGKLGKEAKICFCGHSLGGAVAALLSQPDFVLPLAGTSMSIEACYIFGSPRISGRATVINMRQPFATRRYLDVVPHCPPRILRYASFEKERKPDGVRFILADGVELYFFWSWISSLAAKRFIEHHSMERYRQEVIEVAKRDRRLSSLIKAVGEDALGLRTS